MTTTITKTGDYGLTEYKISNISSTLIDATTASWSLDGTLLVNNVKIADYPFQVENGTDIIMRGGTINGQNSLTDDWDYIYHVLDGNAAGVYSKLSQGTIIQNWDIDRSWDGIRVTSAVNSDFMINNVLITNNRDDSIENDDGLSGLVSNSLFDGTFVGISLADTGTADKTDEVVMFDNVLIRMESYLYNTKVTHQSIFKTEENKSPALSLRNCVFAIDDINHEGQGRLEIAWANVIDSQNNYFLNLSDELLSNVPGGYPMPPAGFTVLEGAAARAYWDTAKSDWLAERASGLYSNGDVTGTVSGDNLIGTTANETIMSLGGNDTINTDGGNDVLNGGSGNDSLVAGNGADIVIGGDGNDTIGGGNGNDRISGNTGDDKITGGFNNDLILGGTGNDTAIFSGTTSATVNLNIVIGQITGRGTDQLLGIENLTGGSAADTLIGDAVANYLIGVQGNDSLVGNAGNDTLEGGLNLDTLVGGSGNDSLTGGGGVDTFVFATGAGVDVISDFVDASDLIRITSGATSFANITVTDSGADAIITFSDVSITLKNVDHALISGADFVFG